MTDGESEADLGKFPGSVALVGAGRMGGAMLHGWFALGLPTGRAVVFEPEPSSEIMGLVARGLRLNPPPVQVSDAAAMVLAVKPQVAAAAVPAFAGVVRPETIVVSIMAGIPLAALGRLLPPGACIVRTMPNTPAAIGRGITVAIPNERVTPAQRDLAHRLLAAIGKVEWVEDESLMDAVTAVSGSGPAYVFLLTEALTDAGIAAGLPPGLAARLARETVAGAGELLYRSGADPATLRRNVTSPGGTTAAALEVLMAPDGLAKPMQRAVAAAARRSRELAG